jgi:hypothetical protein
MGPTHQTTTHWFPSLETDANGPPWDAARASVRSPTSFHKIAVMGRTVRWCRLTRADAVRILQGLSQTRGHPMRAR